MLTPIIVLASCLLLEAFFSGAELALISADKVQLRHRAESAKPRRRKLILSFLEEPGELISAALTGTNICVVLSTVTATVTLLPLYPQQAELISLAVLTPLVLIFGEIVPKSIFQHYADRMAPRLISMLEVFRLLFLPAVAIGRYFSGLVLRAFGLDTHRARMTRDELRLLIKLPSRPGRDRITVEEQKMISRLFDFSETTAEDVMLHLSEVTALPLTATVKEAASEIAVQGHTRLPIYRERVDQIEGIVHSFDVLRAERAVGLEQLMRPAIFVPENQPAVDTLVSLQREGQHMAVVVDEYGGAIGVITIDDILEEIVGEIPDEFDDDDAGDQIRREPGGSFLVSGRVDVSRVNSACKLTLPESDDYETIAGLVIDHVKSIPPVGKWIDVGKYRITVTQASDRAVDEVRIQSARKRG